MANTTSPDRFFHDRYGVSPTALERALGSALTRRADYGDVYFEFRTTAAVSLEDGLVKKASKDVAQGVGVRVTSTDVLASTTFGDGFSHEGDAWLSSGWASASQRTELHMTVNVGAAHVSSGGCQ